VRLPIPDDWDGTTWACFEIQWPDSPLWIALLTGLLSMPAAGRYWNESTGRITDAQEIGRAIFNANYPFNPCAECAENERDCGGILVESDEDMGQVVTDVWIDTDTSELVVEFGPCCIKRFAITGVGEDPVDPADNPDYPPPGDIPGHEEGTACSKARAWCEVIYRSIDVALPLFPDTTPAAIINALKSEYPGYSFGSLDIAVWWAAGLNVVGQGVENNVTADSVRQEILCRVQDKIDGGDEGFTEWEYDAAVKATLDGSKEYFNIFTFPTVHAAMCDIYYCMAKALGKGDSKTATAYTSPAEDDNCLCPGEMPPTYEGDIQFNAWTVEGTETFVEAKNIDIAEGGQYFTATVTYNDQSTQPVWTAPVVSLINAAPDDVIVFRVWPVTPATETPTRNYEDTAPVFNPLLWIDLETNVTGWADTVRAAGPAWLEVEITPSAGGTHEWLKMPVVRRSPGVQSPEKSYEFRVGIAAVNGVSHRASLPS